MQLLLRESHQCKNNEALFPCRQYLDENQFLLEENRSHHHEQCNLDNYTIVVFKN